MKTTKKPAQSKQDIIVIDCDLNGQKTDIRVPRAEAEKLLHDLEAALKPLQLRIEYDNDRPEDFIAEDGWKLYSFNRTHNSYKDPEKIGLSLDRDEDGLPIVEDEELKEKLTNGLAWWLSYYEHGQCLWFIRNTPAPPGVEFRWDGRSLVGILIWEWKPEDIGGKTREERMTDAEGYLKTYTSVMNGEVYCWMLQDGAGDTIESCGGYIDVDDMFDCIRAALKGRPCVVSGEARGLVNYHSLDKEKEDEVD